MRTLYLLPMLLAPLMLAGCAGDVAAPTVVQGMADEQKAALKIASVTADAESGVEVGDNEMETIVDEVKSYINNQTPGILVPAGQVGGKLQIHFTKFDRGNAFARAMLAGLGQIRIEATVTLTDAGGTQIGQYQVAKDFSFGGMVGATTTVTDVEDGFAKSVAAIIKK